MIRPPNLYIECTRSGLVTKEIVQNWFLNIYFKVATKKSLLVIDSLSTYKDTSVIRREKPKEAEMEVIGLINQECEFEGKDWNESCCKLQLNPVTKSDSST